jgi:cytoplasmic iron level regulating protein YaaA (DUF328/UPF0246 family)
MLIILSPAKKLDFKTPVPYHGFSVNRFMEEAETIVNRLRKLSVSELSDIMHISTALANLNYERYRNWHRPFTTENAKAAIFAFNGDAYSGLDAASFDTDDLNYAQNHLRILSALYGVIRPLDLIQPYRIEMGMKFGFDNYKSLYDFWRSKITEAINEDLRLQGDNILINLASEEYFKALDLNTLKAKVITPVFKENKNGILKIVSRNAKRARGMMSRFILKNKITNPEELKLFDMEGYFYSDRPGNDERLVFVRH